MVAGADLFAETYDAKHQAAIINGHALLAEEIRDLAGIKHRAIRSRDTALSSLPRPPAVYLSSHPLDAHRLYRPYLAPSSSVPLSSLA
eukprot:762822-Hanusia_phi.AAC.6